MKQLKAMMQLKCNQLPPRFSHHLPAMSTKAAPISLLPFANTIRDVDDDNANDNQLPLLLIFKLLMMIVMPLLTPPKSILLSKRKRKSPCSCLPYRSHLLYYLSNYAFPSHLAVAVALLFSHCSSGIFLRKQFVTTLLEI